MNTGAVTSTSDPVVTEIIRNAFIAAAEEMNATLIRSAYTPIIYEMKDCSVALLDEHHRVLGQSAGLPIFLGNLEVCTRLIEERNGREAWQPGDVWVLNDSYLTGTHLNDMTVCGPIFQAGELIGFAASRAHWMDVGAKDPGGAMDSTEIYQEGLRIAPIRVVASGELRADVADLITRQSRFAPHAFGDLKAQIAVVQTAERRLAAIFERFGAARVRDARDEVFDQAEQLDREAIAAIPDGTYRAEGCLDNDGIGDQPHWVRVAVTVDGEHMAIDLTESSGTARGPVNCGAAQAISASRVGFKVLVNPNQPVSGGTFRTLDVRVRPGSLLGAEPPAACQWYFSSLGLLIDLVVKALADALPEQAAAATYGDSMVLNMSGVDPRTQAPFLDVNVHVGGWGAWRGGDGQDALINNTNGSLKDLPIEVAETRYPYRVRCYRIRTDSGGAGRWRGGDGIIREFVVEAERAYFNLWFERSKTPPWGIHGGKQGEPPRVTVNSGGSGEEQMLKAAMRPVVRGDVIRCETGGGGGCGDPAERDPDAVRADVADGFVSRASAAADYGVTIEECEA